MDKLTKILIALIIVWFSFILFFFIKADEITRDPCSICAERMKDNVYCQTLTDIPAKRTYFYNGSVYNKPVFIPGAYNIDESLINESFTFDK